MPKRLARPTVSRHYLFYKEDLDFIETHYGPRSPMGHKMNVMIREIIHAWSKGKRKEMIEELDVGVVLGEET